MPGIVVFRRRWGVGSDDLVVPGAFLFTMHLIWIIVLGALLLVVPFDTSTSCVRQLWEYALSYLGLLGLCILNEIAICVVAMRGSILDTQPRASMQYLLYLRVAIMVIESGALSLGVIWMVYNYQECPIERAKETVLGMVVCNSCLLVSILITVWCTYDSAGRSWVKMKKYQRSMKESESKFQYKRSGSNRNWRQRKVLRAYQDSWDQRCKFLFCCMRPSDRNRNSFADIARLLSDFFRDLDVVPSDVVAGLVLLRKFQKIERKAIVEQRKNDTYEFLSGVPVTSNTQFLALHEGGDLELFQSVIHYMHYAMGAYGWPVFVMTYNVTGVVQLCTSVHCCCNPFVQRNTTTVVVDDNCCQCNFAALQKVLGIGDIEVIYVTYHVAVGQTPFYIAVDYTRRKIVLSIRGTLSVEDVLTDLNAEGEPLPLTPPREDWLGHKGMVQAAQYIWETIRTEGLLERAFDHNPEKGTQDFGLVLVGHSLGAGTASILAILMKQQYADLLCFSYSPPGGLLSMPAVEYTKSFITSVVLGKDVVPRIGLHQMEALRADLINAIKRSVDPKWKTITCSVVCCGCGSEPTSAVELSAGETNVQEYMRDKGSAREFGVHPSDSSIALTSHNPLYPPGRIIHIVRHHPTRGEQKYEKRWRQALHTNEPVYQALWAQNTEFDEVLISPVMIQDHMPDTVLEALNKVITNLGPRKPQRLSNNNTSTDLEEIRLLAASSPTPPFKLCLETSFTSLHSPSGAASNASSITNGFHSTKSYPSPLPLHSILSGLEKKYPKPLSQLKCTSRSSPASVDLIHDDWFGLAPLASPESLSEVSSISSRASFTNVEKLNLNYESRTPRVMRRTPKIPGNLSTCADDIKNVRYFQKISSQKFTTSHRCPSLNGSFTNTTNSSGDLSYESASNENEPGSSSHCCIEEEETEIIFGTDDEKRVYLTTSDESDNYQSAENILDNVLESAGCLDFFNDKTAPPLLLETHFDDDLMFHTMTTLVKPQETLGRPVEHHEEALEDQDAISNFAIDLNLSKEHRSKQFTRHQYQNQQPCSSRTTSVDSGSICRTPVSENAVKNVTFNPQVINIVQSANSSPAKGSKSSKRSDKWYLLPRKANKKTSSNQQKCSLEPKDSSKVIHVPRTILCSSKRYQSNIHSADSGDEQCFARTAEALPLLSGLGSTGSEGQKMSPNFVRRKKYVYPTMTIMNRSGGESSV